MSDEIMADIQRSLGRIEQKVDTALQWQTQHVAQDKASFEALSTDIRKIQLGGARQAGKASVITAMLTAAGGGVGGFVTWLFQRHVH